MKKTVKRIILLLTIFSLSLCLCGCDALDKMRQNQGFWGENGEILWNGAVYKELPSDEYLYVNQDDITIVYVTEPDVPVLLSVFERGYYPGEDGLFLSGAGKYYCREDRYQEIQERIYEPFQPDMICCSVTEYNIDAEAEEKIYQLTQEQVQMLALILETEEPRTMGEGWYLYTDIQVALWECSEDLLFRRNSIDLAKSGDTYYLYRYTDDRTLVYAVPEGCWDTCEDIFSAYESLYDKTIEDIGQIL